jgi:hypothetical protein
MLCSVECGAATIYELWRKNKEADIVCYRIVSQYVPAGAEGNIEDPEYSWEQTTVILLYPESVVFLYSSVFPREYCTW